MNLNHLLRNLLLSLPLLLPSFCYATAGNCQNVFQSEIRYKIYGETHKQVLVLLHGMGGDMESFDNIIPYLAEHYKVLVYDQKGHGNSQIIGDDYSTQVMARDLKSLVDYLEISKFAILGHSMGARVAARFAVTYPEMIEKIIVEDMDLIRRTNADPKYQARAVLKANEVRRRLQSHDYSSQKDLRLALSPFFVPNDLLGMMMAAAPRSDGSWTIPGPFSPDIYLKYWNQGNKDADLLQGLANANRPILFIRADAQNSWSAMTAGGLRKISRVLPNAIIVQIPGSDHSVHESAAISYLQTVFAFLNSTP